MSKYTTEVRYICEKAAGLDESKGYNDINTILSSARTSIFDFTYPIFDNTYKSVIETKILKHYYTREICSETVGLWKHYLDMKMNEIMPYYNKLYNSELLSFNPLYDVDVTTTMDKDGTNNSTLTTDMSRIDNLSQSSTDGGSNGISGSRVDKNTRWDVFSDTPQGALTGVQNETYLTNARKIIDDGTGSTFSETDTFGKTNTTTNTGTQRNAGSTTDNVTTTEDYLMRVQGKTGGVSYSKMLEEYRKTFLNIDMMVINELKDLFFGLW